MVDITKMKLLISIILLSLFISCGKSPLTNSGGGSTKSAASLALKSEVSFEKEELSINAYWRVGPELYEENKLLVVFNNSKGNPTDPKLDFHFKLDMPDMSHGSYPVTITRISEGVYELTDLQFFMPGYWTLNYMLHDGDVSNIIETVSVRVDL